MSMRNSPLPDALRSVPVDVIENYVGSQIAMFANGLAHRLGQHGYHIPTDVYKESAREVFQLLISDPSPRRAPQRAQDLQLVFRHDCLALGCLVPSCKLCKHNPSRRCAVNFDKKYLVNDVLKAKCQAVIRVEVVERATNQPIDTCDLRDEIILQMAILDGNTYDAKFEAGMEGDFESCLLLMNNKGSPTLVGTAVSNDANGFIRVPLSSSRAVLPDLRVTDSSEAMLSGRKPPLRLMMRAVYKDSSLPVPHIRHAISEGFVVATRRTRTAGKVDIPSVDDHVSKLEHMGRETVKKLSDVMEAAHQAGIDDLNLQAGPGKRLCIETVGAFQQLVLAAENDAQLQKKLQQVLKLNKEKWEEARDHALKAVVVDNRMRVWWAAHPGGSSSRIGIVFSCTKGTVDLETPIGLIQEGGKPLFTADWSHSQLEFVRQLQPMALSQWWQPNHTNWDLLEWDSEVFKTSGQLLMATMAEVDGPMQCHSSKHGSPRIQGSMNKQSTGGTVMASPFYPAARESVDRGMRHLTGSKDGASAQLLALQHGQRPQKPGQRGNNFPPSNSWEWANSPHAVPRQAMASSTDAPSSMNDRSGLVMEMQTAFEENNGLAHCGQVALDGNSAAATIPCGSGAYTPSIRSDNLTDPMAVANTTPPGVQDYHGGATRLLSGMSVEGLVHDHANNLLMSRNTSGLDTMQSIEQALPDGDNAHPPMNA